MRYSDEDLNQFKELILKRLSKAYEDINFLKTESKNESGTDDTSPQFKLLEESNDFMSKEERQNLIFRQTEYIEKLEKALVRIENKTFGICRATGKQIERERLLAVPHATLSMEGKNRGLI